MADKITWADKESLVTDPTIAEINKVTDDNMNEIKSVTNTNADELTEKIVYDESDITENTGLIIEEVPEGSNIPYINSEIAIGSTNEDNRPVWFKQGKNLFTDKRYIVNASISSNGEIISGTYQLYYVPVVAGKTYSMATGTSNRQWVYTFTTNIPTIGETGATRIVNSSATETFTVPTGYNYLVLRRTDSGGEVISNLMINEGTSVDTYEAYIPPSIIADNTEFYSQAEIGENSNGKYIKYADGTMICTGVKSFTGANFTTQNGAVYIPATSPSINFAQQFIENPVVTLTAFNRANGVYESGLSTSLVAIWPFAFSSITNVNYSIHYIAIGRWK